MFYSNRITEQDKEELEKAEIERKRKAGECYTSKHTCIHCKQDFNVTHILSKNCLTTKGENENEYEICISCDFEKRNLRGTFYATECDEEKKEEKA